MSNASDYSFITAIFNQFGFIISIVASLLAIFLAAFLIGKKSTVSKRILTERSQK